MSVKAMLNTLFLGMQDFFFLSYIVPDLHIEHFFVRMSNTYPVFLQDRQAWPSK